MSDESSKLKLYISTLIMTFLGVLSVWMSFLNTFYEDKYCEPAAWIFIALIFSAGFSAAVVFMKRKWIVPVSVVALLVPIVYANFYEIIGGFGTLFNTVANAASEYLQADVLYVYMSKKMVRYSDPGLFCYILAALLPLIFSYTIHYKKVIVIPILIIAAALGIPVLFEVFPSFFAVLFGIIYCIQLVVISVVPGKITENSRFSVHVTALLFGTVLMLVGGIVNIIVPSGDFERSQIFEELKAFITNGEFPEWNRKSPLTGTIGGGSLGHVDELRFQGAEVLEVELPVQREKIYIKGYIGETYDGNRWYQPDVDDKDLFSDLLENDYPQQTMVSTYLEKLAEWDGGIPGYKAMMKIKYLSSFRPYRFIPVYSVMNYSLSYDADEVVSSAREDEWIEYFMPDESAFEVSNSDIDGIMTGTSYGELNERYTEYVYEHYLDVSTTMKDELEDEWDGYRIETAADRFLLAENIKKYLDDNCTYTTSPGKLPSGKDFVEYFLSETKQGYCTYFATAAVMMFRSAGVPARYVEGYAFYSGSDAEPAESGKIYYYNNYEVSENDVDYGKITVKDYHAHAWVEFYIDGIGWIDYEVTPGGGTADVPPETESQKETTEGAPVTEPATSETSSDENTTTTAEDSTAETTTEESHAGTDEDNNNGGGFSFKLPERLVKILVISFIALLSVALIIFIMIISHSRIKHERLAVYDEDKKKLTGKSIIMYYELFERLMKKCGFRRALGMTYMDFALLVEKECYAVGVTEAQRLTRIYEKIHYSGEQVTIAEIDEAQKLYVLIKQRIYENMGSIGKIIFTYISNY